MYKAVNRFNIGDTTVGWDHPTYFIADIAANHDGDLERAKDLIHMVAECGGNAAKFQHFTAETIVSDYGFKSLGTQISHQAKWNKSVYEVYQDASIDTDWTPILKETCDKVGIDFFTSPYSFDLVDLVDPYVSAYKVGSGDVTWPQIIQYMAKREKPMLIATGASSLDEVYCAVNACLNENSQICLMQCNTNYTASLDNFKYIQLNVLKTYQKMFPGMILGLSDHTPGHATVLGAVSLGARLIEKHFTDSNNREGPDHKFSMNPKTWKDMVDRTRELEAALGSGIKKIEDNEKDTVILQRRCIRVVKDLPSGYQIRKSDIIYLRPCPADAFTPAEVDHVIGKIIHKDLKRGEYLSWKNLVED